MDYYMYIIWLPWKLFISSFTRIYTDLMLQNLKLIWVMMIVDMSCNYCETKNIFRIPREAHTDLVYYFEWSKTVWWYCCLITHTLGWMLTSYKWMYNVRHEIMFGIKYYCSPRISRNKQWKETRGDVCIAGAVYRDHVTELSRFNMMSCKW